MQGQSNGTTLTPTQILPDGPFKQHSHKAQAFSCLQIQVMRYKSW